MKRFFKLFVSLFMVAVLGIGISVSVMATDYEVAGAEQEDISSIEVENKTGDQIGGMSGYVNIRPGANLGTCYVPGRARTIEVSINGVRGNIILKFTNEDTGDFRTFGAIGNSTHSLEYVSSMDAGNWNVSVMLCDNNANNCSFNIKFYK